jgi:hypothetical protein
MEPTRKKVTCAICLDEPTSDKLAKLDCCSHVYCFSCIKHWVEESESNCPQCKLGVQRITYKNEANEEAIFEVEFRHQRMRQRNYNCSTCAQHIQQSNFGQTGGNDQAMICDMCQSEAIHVRCATGEVRRLISQTQIWLCERCRMILTIR